jgi:hypothetical protein
MRHIFLLLFLFCVETVIFAQNEKPVEIETVLHLKNSMIVRGHLIEWVQGDYLVIQTRDSLKLWYAETQILKIKQKRYGGPSVKHDFNHAFLEHGLYNATNFGFILNHFNNENNFGVRQKPSFTISHAVGWQMNRFSGFGAGLGLDFYGQNEILHFLPIFFDFRTYFLAQKRTPYFNLMAGHGIPLVNKNDEINTPSSVKAKSGGAFFAANAGFRLEGRTLGHWTIDFGVRLQKASFELFSFGTQINRELLYRRYTIRTGLIF